MGCPVLATWSREDSNHLAPGRLLLDSRYAEDDVTFG